MNRIVVIGLNPSTQSPDLSAFHPATRSGARIRKWMEGIDDVEYINVHEYKLVNINVPYTYNEKYKLLRIYLLDRLVLMFECLGLIDVIYQYDNDETIHEGYINCILRKKILSKFKFIVAGNDAYKKFMTYDKYIPITNILKVPHPSGRNRKFNDPNFEQQVIDSIREFCK